MNTRLNFGKISALLLIVWFAVSCHDLKKEADLIIFNAKIYTPDSTDRSHDCIVVNDGLIVEVGTDSYIRSRYWSKKVINASGAFVYPGFTDAHSHLTGLAKGLRYADLSQAQSFDEVLEILVDFRKKHPEGWLTGFGWDQNNWKVKTFPDNKLLNKLFPDVPVVLIRIDGHALLANQAAIKACEVNFPGRNGEAEIENGDFSGIFLETMADDIRNKIPVPSDEEFATLMKTAVTLCHQAGLTSVTDAGLTKNEILMIDSLQKAGIITLRVDAWLSPTEENFTYFLKDSIYNTPWLRIGAIKLYADGALGSRGACLINPYFDDPATNGIIVTNRNEIRKVCRLAYEHGLQMNTHAIGDSAVRMVLDCYSEFLKPDNDLRWRIEHAQVVNETDFTKFGLFSVIPSVQTTHATSDMDWAPKRLGNVRVKNAYAYKKLLLQNGWLPNGTDFPIESIEPIKTFYAAVARKNLSGEPEKGFQPENALSRMEALKSITTWAAKASFNEKFRGSLQKGLAADFTILDSDLIHMEESKILKTKVLYTIVGGKILYEAK